tara:strand:+ start:158 stop:379 length:222 start_codon:yes stop_codon:yes gene_type:complete
MDDNPEFMKRFLGLVQGVRSGTLNLQIDGDIVVVGISTEDNQSREIRIPSHLFMTSDVNNILVALGEREKDEN